MPFRCSNKSSSISGPDLEKTSCRMNLRHFPSHMGQFALYGVRNCMAMIRLLTVLCSVLHPWNHLKLASKGHCWGWQLLPFLIQHHGSTRPEGSLLNSSLTLTAGRYPHHIILDFVVWQPVLLHFKFAEVPFVRKLLFPDMPQKPLDIMLASCAGLPTDVQE